MSPHQPRSGPPTAGSTSDDQPRLGITFNQLVGSALAAAAAAFGASFLGVAGTIIGAAVASVIATVASALYSRSLQRTRLVVQSTVTQWSRPVPAAPAAADDVPSSGPGPRRRPVVRLAGAAVAVMALTFGALTGVEAVLGQPIASLLGGSSAGGTTLGSVGTPGTTHARQRAKAAKPSTSTPTVIPATPATEPSATPSTDPAAPTTTPPATPTGTPSGTPTSGPTAPPSGTPSG